MGIQLYDIKFIELSFKEFFNKKNIEHN